MISYFTNACGLIIDSTLLDDCFSYFCCCLVVLLCRYLFDRGDIL